MHDEYEQFAGEDQARHGLDYRGIEETGRKRTRRQSHGSAWHWKQTDAWYYTLPGAKKRVSLFDEDGQRIKGKDKKRAAELALARVKLQGDWDQQPVPIEQEEWLVARVCSDYLQYRERGITNGRISQGHRDTSRSLLNDLCRYCGALRVAQLKKGHVKNWLESHAGWTSPATHRGAISIVLAAFNRAEEDHGVTNPLKGLKKPKSEPKLQSFTKEEEEAKHQSTAKRSTPQVAMQLSRLRCRHCQRNPFILVVLLTALPSHFYLAALQADVDRKGVQVWLMAGTTAACLTGLIATYVPTAIGLKAFRSLEF